VVTSRLSRGTKRAVLEYGPAFVWPGLWAYSRFPEQLRWAADFYGKIWGNLAAMYETWTEVDGYGETLTQAIGSIGINPKTILDMGTGTGFVARKLKTVFLGASVVGTDISNEMISVAEHLAMTEGLEIRFVQGDSEHLDLEDGSFDLVALQNSLPFPDEIMRLVAPGGVALFVVSLAGPWAQLGWPSLAERFEQAGATETYGRRAGLGFFGIAKK
jgi:SAM-dependent methyltransferase